MSSQRTRRKPRNFSLMGCPRGGSTFATPLLATFSRWRKKKQEERESSFPRVSYREFLGSGWLTANNLKGNHCWQGWRKLFSSSFGVRLKIAIFPSKWTPWTHIKTLRLPVAFQKAIQTSQMRIHSWALLTRPRSKGFWASSTGQNLRRLRIL